MRDTIFTVVVTTSLLMGCAGVSAMAKDKSLLGYWPLMGDARDHSDYQNHGVNHGAGLKADHPASFDGKNSYIEIPHSESLALNAGEFSIIVSVNTQDDLDDVIGDLLSKFDSASRKGFQLSIKNHAGVTSSQANDRHLHFGIDNGLIEPQWTDHGQLGDAILIYSMAVYKGQILQERAYLQKILLVMCIDFPAMTNGLIAGVPIYAIPCHHWQFWADSSMRGRLDIV